MKTELLGWYTPQMPAPILVVLLSAQPTPLDVSRLNSLLGGWEIAEYISAGVVILGVVGEFLAEFTDLFNQEHNRRRLGKGSTLILIAGLAMELVSLVRTSQLSSQITARLNQEAGQARIDAGNAMERAGKANERAAASEAVSELLRKENLLLQKSVIKLQKTLSWRTLQPEQELHVVANLKRFAGTQFTIRTYSDDQEAVHLTEMIARDLVLAGWTHLQTSHVMAFSLVRGISIEVAPSHASELGAAAKALASALNAAGIDAVEKTNPGEEHEDHAGMIHIRIGKKPSQ